MKPKLVNCPQCGKAAILNSDNPYRPFCSERCKMQDLAQWATECYRITENAQEENNSQKSE